MIEYYKQFEVVRGGELNMSVQLTGAEDGYQTHFYIGDSVTAIEAGAFLVEKHTNLGITHVATGAEWVVDDADVANLPKNYYAYVWRVVYEAPDGNRTPVDVGSLKVVIR